MLYLVATPIGNLKDLTFRAVEVLKQVDYILSEDTSHTRHLLNHYDIKTAQYSFHKFNEVSKEEKILEDLRSGKNIALVSDAGTPGIADPGNLLVKRCRKENLSVTAIPGACAAIAALVSSGLSTDRFQFCGFLPKQQASLRAFFAEILSYSGTTICYESPHRLLQTLLLLRELAPKRLIAIARELTKTFEEQNLATAEELVLKWQDKKVKGEIVLLISEQNSDESEEELWQSLSPKEHVEQLEKHYNLKKREAIKLAANLRGINARQLYNSLIEEK